MIFLQNNFTFRDFRPGCQGDASLVFSVCGLFTLDSCKYINENHGNIFNAEQNNTIRLNLFCSIEEALDEGNTHLMQASPHFRHQRLLALQQKVTSIFVCVGNSVVFKLY